MIEPFYKMPQQMKEEVQEARELAHHPHPLRTETRESLHNLGVSEKPPPLDDNYPAIGRESDPVFPEEYTLETKTGLVPKETLEQIRSEPSCDKPSKGTS